MKKKKIAVIGTRGVPATYGGIEKHCEDLYTLLAQMDYEVEVYARNYYIADDINEYKNIKIKKIPVLNIKGFETFIYSFVSTIMACFSDADIVHFHAQGPTVFSWIPRILCPHKKVVFTCHGIDWQRDKWGLMGRTIIKLGELASAAFPHVRICVSDYLSDYYQEKYHIKTEKIFNGVEIKEKIPAGPCCEKFSLSLGNYIIFVGRLVPEKAPDALIKAFKNSSTNKKLVIVGGEAGIENYYEDLKKLAKDDNRIVFTDYLYGADIQELYSNALCYISASKLEGLPITLLEAMSYGLPVVLSDIPPHNEVINLDSKIGISFKTNDINSCTDAINQVTSTSLEEIKQMGQISLNTVKEHFNWEHIAALTDQAYKISMLLSNK